MSSSTSTGESVQSAQWTTDDVRAVLFATTIRGDAQANEETPESWLHYLAFMDADSVTDDDLDSWGMTREHYLQSCHELEERDRATYQRGVHLLHEAVLIHTAPYVNQSGEYEREQLRRQAQAPFVEVQEGWLATSPRYRSYSLRTRQGIWHE